jgi:nucleoside-diphosphate-sugar epimerase
MNQKQKVLVTGGAGYIGSIFVPRLLKAGYAVTVLDNFSFRQTSLLDVCIHPDLEIIVGDVRDAILLKELVLKHDIIFPLACIVGAPACDRDTVLAAQVNQEQIENIEKWMSKDQKVLFPVTNSGYGIGQKGKFCDENTPLNPISQYGRTKVNAEKALLDNGNAVTFRLATVFGVGPRMRMDLLVNDFVYRAFNDRFIVLFEAHFKRNYIHIRDIAEVFLHGLENYESLKGEPYNVGLGDANISKMELCEKIKSHLPDFHIFESELAEDPDKRDYIVSNEKIEGTGWKPKYGLDDGIQELIKLYRFLPVNSYTNI